MYLNAPVHVNELDAVDGSKTKRPRRRMILAILLVVSVTCALLSVGLYVFCFDSGPVYTDCNPIKMDVNRIEAALMRYKMLTGSMPSESQGIEAMVKRPSGAPQPKMWTQCLEEEKLRDPWGEPYQYRNPGKHKTNDYDIFSKGPDKQEGTRDDIGNW